MPTSFPISSDLVNVAAHLPRMAERQPHLLAVAFPHGRDRQGRVSYTHYTYRQLNDASDELARGLEAVGIRRGTRTVLMVRPSLDFFALTFALFKVGAVPVMIDPGLGTRQLGRCLAEAQPEAFIGIAKAHLGRRLLGWGRGSVRVCVTVGSRFGGIPLERVRRLGRSGAPYALPPVRPEEVAAILFTSGSTGSAKGVVYTHGNFAAQVEALRQLFDIQPGEIDLPTFPLFGLFAPALGMTSIIPDMDFTRPARVDPRKLIEAVENFGVTNMFGSPALIDRLGRHGAAHGTRLPSLRRVISAGAPVPAATIERFVFMLSPGVQVFTPYGATECLPVACIGSDEILADTRHQTVKGAGVCVGRPVPGLRVAVIAIRDAPISMWDDSLTLPAGQIGEIVVQGPLATAAYHNRAEATRLAKILDPQGGFYHRMGDVGYFDGGGRLWFCGRKSQRVRTAAETLFTIPCEAVFNTHPAVARSALVGVTRQGQTEPVLCVELEAAVRRRDGDRIRQELLALAATYPHTRAIRTILFHPAFPVDIRHNAKIFREQLATWAARRERKKGTRLEFA